LAAFHACQCSASRKWTRGKSGGKQWKTTSLCALPGKRQWFIVSSPRVVLDLMVLSNREYIFGQTVSSMTFATPATSMNSTFPLSSHVFTIAWCSERVVPLNIDFWPVTSSTGHLASRYSNNNCQNSNFKVWIIIMETLFLFQSTDKLHYMNHDLPK